MVYAQLSTATLATVVFTTSKRHMDELTGKLVGRQLVLSELLG